LLFSERLTTKKFQTNLQKKLTRIIVYYYLAKDR